MEIGTGQSALKLTILPMRLTDDVSVTMTEPQGDYLRGHRLYEQPAETDKIRLVCMSQGQARPIGTTVEYCSDPDKHSRLGLCGTYLSLAQLANVDASPTDS